MHKTFPSPDKKIAILIPCYNEERTIYKVVSDFKTMLPSAEIYVYDNNSEDNTNVFAQNAGAIVIKEPRQGKGNVIKSMFYDIDADIYVLVDGDDTYPSDSIIDLINPIINEGYDMVVGDRLAGTYFTENTRKFHNFGNKIIRYTINKIFNSNINDVLSGYRAFNKKFIKNFPIISQGFEIETEMTVHSLDKGFYVKEIPINYKERPIGSESKLNTFSDGYRVFKTIFKLFCDYKPVAFFSVLALVLFIIGISFLIPILLEFFKTGLVPKFPTLIGICAILTCSTLLVLVGVILGSNTRHHRRLYEMFRLQNDYKNVK